MGRRERAGSTAMPPWPTSLSLFLSFVCPPADLSQRSWCHFRNFCSKKQINSTAKTFSSTKGPAVRAHIIAVGQWGETLQEIFVPKGNHVCLVNRHTSSQVLIFSINRNSLATIFIFAAYVIVNLGHLEHANVFHHFLTFYRPIIITKIIKIAFGCILKVESYRARETVPPGSEGSITEHWKMFP